jgi:hypothetical protein
LPAGAGLGSGEGGLHKILSGWDYK